MKKLHLFGALCALFLLTPYVASAKTVWGGTYVSDPGYQWTLWLVTDGDTVQAPGNLIDAYFDSGANGLINPTDLLTMSSSDIAEQSGDPLDVSTAAIYLFSAEELNLYEIIITQMEIDITQSTDPVDRILYCDGETCTATPALMDVNSTTSHVFSIDHYFLPVATSPIPLPPTILLFGSGLIGLIGLSKRRSA
jgi:hypothetical protein